MLKIIQTIIVVGILFPVAGFTMDYYVNGATGSDTATCGQQPTTPCKTVKHAFANIPAGGGNVYIKIARGTYVEGNMWVTNNSDITFEGGWNSDFTSHTCSPENTTLNTGNSDGGWESFFNIYTSQSGQNPAVEIRCMTLKKVSSGDINSAVGIRVNSHASGTLTLDKVRITGFTQEAVMMRIISPAGSLDAIDVTMNEVVFDSNTGIVDVIQANTSAGKITLDMQKCSVINNGDMDNSHHALGLFSAQMGEIDATLKNCIIAGNAGKHTENAGIYLQGSTQSVQSLKLVNSTITDNICLNNGCGLAISGGNTSQLTISMDNTILYGNRSSQDHAADDLYIAENDASTIKFTGDYSILGAYGKVGNPQDSFNHGIYEDPYLDSTYHLKQGSPAIDAGICATNYIVYWRIAPYDDIDGDRRPGYGILLGCDIGADEYHFPWPTFLPAITGHSHHQ